jgi:hypothetical protein
MTWSTDGIKKLAEAYGPWAIGIYLAIFFSVWAGFAVAIHFGLTTDGLGGNAGVIAAAWVATKATQPLRIAGTVALTPLLARLWRKNQDRDKPTDTPVAPA